VPIDHRSPDITELLLAWESGDEKALGQLTPLVYDHLRRLAQHLMAGERLEHTLQATALVHEAYLRLADCRRLGWHNRAQFFALAAKLMRRILVDFARSHRNQKRGGRLHKTSLDAALLVSARPDPQLIELDDALNELSTFDARKAQVVELRFFGGLKEDEIAEVLKISVDTVQRDWKSARVWLFNRLRHDSSRG
jgi:RNA polymerase sigma factor (TIGR02999 family)